MIKLTSERKSWRWTSSVWQRRQQQQQTIRNLLDCSKEAWANLNVRYKEKHRRCHTSNSKGSFKFLSNFMDFLFFFFFFLCLRRRAWVYSSQNINGHDILQPYNIAGGMVLYTNMKHQKSKSVPVIRSLRAFSPNINIFG